jgi:SAM-dependent methyltransferase
MYRPAVSVAYRIELPPLNQSVSISGHGTDSVKPESKLPQQAIKPSSASGAIDTWKQLWLSKGLDPEKPLHVIDGFNDLSEEEYNNLIYGALNLLDVDLSQVTNVLELGSGAGAFARTILLRWPHLNITGIDFSPTMISISNQKVPGNFFVHDLSDPLPFDDAYFDFVITWSTSFYLKRSVMLDLLWECKRVSRHGMYIGDVSDERKRVVAENIRKQTHGHLKSIPTLTHTYIEPRFFIKWAAEASYWARFSEEDSLADALAGKYEQARYRFSVALVPLPPDVSKTYWEIDASAIGSVCAQPPFTRQHFKLSEGYTCPFKQSFYDFTMERIDGIFQVRVSNWLHGCVSSQGAVSLKLFKSSPQLSSSSSERNLVRWLNSSDLKEFESTGFVLPQGISYATVHCHIKGRNHEFERQGVVVNTPFFMDALNSAVQTQMYPNRYRHQTSQGQNEFKSIKNAHRSVFYLQIDAVSRIRLQLELPKLFSFLSSLNNSSKVKAVDFSNMIINGQNTDPNWIAGLCNGDCSRQSLFDLAKQNNISTMYYNNYCPLYPFPWRGGKSSAGPDVTLLPELNCLEGDGGFVAPCQFMEDSSSTAALVALFDAVMYTSRKMPIFAFGTLNDGHCEDISKLIRMEELIIQKLKDLISSSWFQAGGVFIFGSDHGLHYWNGVSIDLHPESPYAFSSTPLVSSHRNPPMFVVFNSETGLSVNEGNTEAIISHYDVYRTIKFLLGLPTNSDDLIHANLFSKSVFGSRSCSTLDEASRYCNCWRQCIPRGNESAVEFDFLQKLQGLKECK